MIYSMNSPYILGAIDSYVTGYNEPEDTAHCCNCGKRIKAGESCYDVNEDYYCMCCADIAEDAILEIERPKYIFEMEREDETYIRTSK